MKIKPLNKDIVKVLERIQASIPKEWLDNISHKEMLAPRQAKLIRDIANGIDNPDIDNSKITDRMREQAKSIVDSGQISELEKMIDIENKDTTKQIDTYIENEIEKARARGELPKGKKFRNLKKKIQWKKK